MIKDSLATIIFGTIRILPLLLEDDGRTKLQLFFSMTFLNIISLSFIAIKYRLKKWFFTNIKKIPYVRNRIQAEVSGTVKGMQETFNKDIKTGYLEHLPKKGLGEVCILILYCMFV